MRGRRGRHGHVLIQSLFEHSGSGHHGGGHGRDPQQPRRRVRGRRRGRAGPAAVPHAGPACCSGTASCSAVGSWARSSRRRRTSSSSPRSSTRPRSAGGARPPAFPDRGGRVQLEPGLWEESETVRSLGLEPVRESAITPFGGGQAIFVERAASSAGPTAGRTDSRRGTEPDPGSKRPPRGERDGLECLARGCWGGGVS